MRHTFTSATTLILALAGPAAAQPINYTRIANTTTAIPGGTGNFNFFTFPAIASGRTAFHAAGPGGQDGIYSSTAGVLTTAYNQQTPIPNGVGNFTFLSLPALAGASMAFVGVGSSNQEGVYTDIGGTLQRVADLNTAIPGGTGNFTDLGAVNGTPVIQGANVGFGGAGAGGQVGIYRWTGGVNTVVANQTTIQPGGAGPFTNLSSPAIDGSRTAFFGSAPQTGGGFRAGVYLSDSGGPPAVAADTSMAAPGGTGNFVAFGAPGLVGQTVIFTGLDGANDKGIYSSTGGTVSVLYDTNTQVPSGTGTFTDLGDQSSVDGANIAFYGVDSAGIPGIFVRFNGTLIKVVDSNTPLDGRTIDPLSLGLVGNQLSGNQVAFYAAFTDGVFGVYTATIVPEPSALLLVGVGAWAWRRRLAATRNLRSGARE